MKLVIGQFNSAKPDSLLYFDIKQSCSHDDELISHTAKRGSSLALTAPVEIHLAGNSLQTTTWFTASRLNPSE